MQEVTSARDIRKLRRKGRNVCSQKKVHICRLHAL